MTNEQAIETLIEIQSDCLEEAVSINVAIEALRKQIPKKPNKILQAYEYRFGDCPSCNKSSDMNYKHCRYCGQNLDWSD